jgi:hypothetical protein
MMMLWDPGIAWHELKHSGIVPKRKDISVFYYLLDLWKNQAK